ncbi:MAG TPA: hypothetical protein VK153_03285 [Candidatus Paceibacterota bacterium]|nr:hypothetical protein [Candidatus Paceibacterota bacterium]
METKVTFTPLKRGRYRPIVNGVLKPITKNPKRIRFIIIRAHDNERIRAMREEEKRKEAEEKRRKWGWY